MNTEKYHIECIDGKLKCPHTQQACIVDDTAAFSSCSICRHNPDKAYPVRLYTMADFEKGLMLAGHLLPKNEWEADEKRVLDEYEKTHALINDQINQPEKLNTMYNPTCFITGKKDNLKMHPIRNDNNEMTGWLFVHEDINVVNCAHIQNNITVFPQRTEISVVGYQKNRVDNL